MKIGILGEKKSVLAFRALGLETFGVSKEEELKGALAVIGGRDFAVIFITEDIMEKYEKELEPLTREVLPAVLVVPGVRGAGHKGRDNLKRIMERALGSEMGFNN